MTVPPAPGGCVSLHGSGRASPALDTGLGSALRPAAGFWASHWTLCSGISRKRGVAGGLRSSPSGQFPVLPGVDVPAVSTSNKPLGTRGLGFPAGDPRAMNRKPCITTSKPIKKLKHGNIHTTFAWIHPLVTSRHIYFCLSHFLSLHSYSFIFLLLFANHVKVTDGRCTLDLQTHRHASPKNKHIVSHRTLALSYPRKLALTQYHLTCSL